MPVSDSRATGAAPSSHGRSEPGLQDQQRTLVVAGNGMVGQRLVEAVRNRDKHRAWRVTVLSEEPRRAYDRVALSSYFDGAAAADLDVVADGCYDSADYTLRLDEAVTAVDRAARTVTTSRGAVLGYDALALATGSYPFVPPVPGRDLPNSRLLATLANGTELDLDVRP